MEIETVQEVEQEISPPRLQEMEIEEEQDDWQDQLEGEVSLP